jgi:hypothetical protein
LQLHYGLNDEHIPKSEVDAVIAAAKGKFRCIRFAAVRIATCFGN